MKQVMIVIVFHIPGSPVVTAVEKPAVPMEVEAVPTTPKSSCLSGRWQ